MVQKEIENVCITRFRISPGHQQQQSVNGAGSDCCNYQPPDSLMMKQT